MENHQDVVWTLSCKDVNTSFIHVDWLLWWVWDQVWLTNASAYATIGLLMKRSQCMVVVDAEIMKHAWWIHLHATRGIFQLVLCANSSILSIACWWNMYVGMLQEDLSAGSLCTFSKILYAAYWWIMDVGKGGLHSLHLVWTMTLPGLHHEGYNSKRKMQHMSITLCGWHIVDHCLNLTDLSLVSDFIKFIWTSLSWYGMG